MCSNCDNDEVPSQELDAVLRNTHPFQERLVLETLKVSKRSAHGNLSWDTETQLRKSTHIALGMFRLWGRGVMTVNLE